MKKFLFLIAMLTIALPGCTEWDEPDSQLPTISIINSDTEELNFSSGASEQTVAFKSNCNWSATTSDEWIKVSPSSGKAGENCEVTVSIEENTSHDPRHGKVTISIDGMSIDLAVTQDKKNILILSTSQVKLPQAGGSFEVVVKSNIDFTYAIKADWIKAVTSRALTENTMRFEAEANPDVDSRKGEIVFKGDGYTETVTVTQSQNNVITLSTSTVEIDTKGGNFSVQVSSNIEYKVEIESECDWISQIESRALTTSTLNFAVAENTSKVDRSATISISGEGVSEKITVNQKYVSPNPNNKIIYTSTNGDIVEPYDSAAFNANIVSNTYKNGQGIIEFDADLTTIGKEAFYKSPTLMSISIPSSVTSIGTNAFADCSALTKLNISDLSAWCKIDFANYSANPLYGGAKFYLNGTEITELTIPADITEIKPYSFYGFNRLKGLNIHDKVTFVKECAFCRCSSLENVIIGNKVLGIESSAFSTCKSLKELTIGEGLQWIQASGFYNCDALQTINISSYNVTIGNNAFENVSPTRVNIHITDWSKFCVNTLSDISGERHLYVDGKEITDLVIPDNVTEIGNYAFIDCTSLTSITVPKSITSVGSRIFSNCTGTLVLNSKIIEEGNDFIWAIKDSKFTKLIIGNNVEVVNGFAECTTLQSVVISDSATTIKGSAFASCSSLKDLDLGKGVKTIETSAFRDCISLTKITIPDSVTLIDGGYYDNGLGVGIPLGAFSGCTNLAEVTMGRGVKEVGSCAFYGCNLKKWHTSDLKAWCNIAFEGSSGVNPSSTARLYLNGAQIKDLVIPSGVKKVNSFTFYQMGLTSITCADSVTEIDVYAFAHNYDLTRVQLSANLTYIGDGVFANNLSLTDIVLPETLERLGSGYRGSASMTQGGFGMIGTEAHLVADGGVFYNCPKIKSITIPKNVTKIGGNIFRECTSIEAVYCYPTTPPDITNAALYNNGKIYVSEASYEIYKRYWSEYADLIEVDDSRKENSDGNVIYYTTNTGNTVTPVGSFGLAKIVSNTYQNGQGVITFDQNVTTLEKNAFKGLTSLTSIVLPKHLVIIEESAFNGCKSLANITFGDKLTYIDKYAFAQCKSLTDITIPEGVLEIGELAFRGCSALTNLVIPNSITKIARETFSDCTSLKNVTIGKGVASIESLAFNNCTSLPVIDNIRYADSFLVGAVNKGYSSYTIKEGTRFIDQGAFENCSGITQMTIPNGVVSIGGKAFSGCSSLTRINIPESVTMIDNAAFASCTGTLTINNKTMIEDEKGSGEFTGCLSESNFSKIILGDNITRIRERAFSGLTTQTIEIGRGIVEIGKNAFAMCYLQYIDIPSNVKSIGENAFENCDELTRVTIPSSVTSIDQYAFWGCNSLKSVTIPNSVTSMGGYVFAYCDSLESVTIGNNVPIIDKWAFCKCTSLKNVVIGKGVKIIESEAFDDCSALEEIVIPDNVETIASEVFYSCDNLRKVTIGSGVSKIGSSVFGYCPYLSEIYCKPTTPPTIYESTFSDIASNYVIYVPNSDKDRVLWAYKEAKVWRSYYKSKLVGYDF